MDLIGDASKARIIAFIIDNLLACLISILTVGLIHTDSSIVGGPSDSNNIACFGSESYLVRWHSGRHRNFRLREEAEDW